MEMHDSNPGEIVNIQIIRHYPRRHIAAAADCNDQLGVEAGLVYCKRQFARQSLKVLPAYQFTAKPSVICCPVISDP